MFRWGRNSIWCVEEVYKEICSECASPFFGFLCWIYFLITIFILENWLLIGICTFLKSHSFRANRRERLKSDRSHRVRSFSRSFFPGQRFLVVNLHISATGDVIDVVKSAAFRFRDYDQLFIVNLKKKIKRRKSKIGTLTSPPPATCETLSNVPHLDLTPLQSDLLDLIFTFPPFGVWVEFVKLPHFDLTFVRSSFCVVIFTFPPPKKL